MRVGLVVLAVVALLLGAAGGATLALEHRLAALAPGGVEIAALHYNPFSGRLVLTDVRAHGATVRDLFRADAVLATVNPLHLLVRPLTLTRARVTAPRLTLPAASGLDIAGLAAALGTAPGAVTNLPLRIEDLAVAGGRVVVEGAGPAGAPLVARDLDVRLSRLTTAALGEHLVAFVVEMRVYGALLHLTGQPQGKGYAVHVRGRGLDAARLARDVGMPVLAGLERGQGEIDAEVLLVDGRLLASGSARATDVLLTLPVSGRPRLRAATVAVALDTFDLASGTGRISRLDLGTPVLSLPAATALPTLAELAELLRHGPELLIRRVAVTDGMLTLQGRGGVRLQGLQVAAHAPERRGHGAWIVSARAGLGADAAVTLEGVVTRDLRGLDVLARVHRVAVASWRALAGVSAEWDARVSFDGHLRVAARQGESAVTLTGQAVLADVGRGGFRAERIAVGIRQLQWPSDHAIVDRVVMTRPAFALPAVLPWPQVLVTGGVSVVDGQLHAVGAGRTLHDLEVSLAPTTVAGGAHLRLSASTEIGDRLGVDRIVSYEAGAQDGVPLHLLLGVLEDAAHSIAQPHPATMPVTVFP